MTLLTDAQRRTLHEGAQKAMGKEPADILLAGLPPRGWDDLATKADLRITKAVLRTEIATMRADLTDKIAGLSDKISTQTWVLVGTTLGGLISMAAVCVAAITRS
jgi:hypothetical protein